MLADMVKDIVSLQCPLDEASKNIYPCLPAELY